MDDHTDHSEYREIQADAKSVMLANNDLGILHDISDIISEAPELSRPAMNMVITAMENLDWKLGLETFSISKESLWTNTRDTVAKIIQYAKDLFKRFVAWLRKLFGLDEDRKFTEAVRKTKEEAKKQKKEQQQQKQQKPPKEQNAPSEKPDNKATEKPPKEKREKVRYIRNDRLIRDFKHVKNPAEYLAIANKLRGLTGAAWMIPDALKALSTDVGGLHQHSEKGIISLLFIADQLHDLQTQYRDDTDGYNVAFKDFVDNVALKTFFVDDPLLTKMEPAFLAIGETSSNGVTKHKPIEVTGLPGNKTISFQASEYAARIGGVMYDYSALLPLTTESSPSDEKLSFIEGVPYDMIEPILDLLEKLSLSSVVDHIADTEAKINKALIEITNSMGKLDDHDDRLKWISQVYTAISSMYTRRIAAYAAIFSTLYKNVVDDRKAMLHLCKHSLWDNASEDTADRIEDGLGYLT